MKQLFLFTFAVMQVACGTDVGAGPIAGDTDAAADDEIAGTDATSDAVADVADVLSDTCTGQGYDAPVCSGSGKLSFPAFSKSCSADGDCAVAIHQISCCGTKVAWGLAACAMSQFAKAEAQCDGQYPPCGCPAFSTMAEDGYTSFTSSDFAAKCDGGTCRSYVKSAKPTCSAQGLVEPKPVKTCSTTTDCDVSPLITDCCGSQTLVGIAKFAKASWDVAQVKCGSSIALCACAPAPTKLEDGKTAPTSAVPLQCVNGSCLTGTY